jgi:hypothetical protein
VVPICILGPRLLQDGEVGIGIFPENKKLLVCVLGLRRFVGDRVRPAKLQFGEAECHKCSERTMVCSVARLAGVALVLVGIVVLRIART